MVSKKFPYLISCPASSGAIKPLLPASFSPCPPSLSSFLSFFGRVIVGKCPSGSGAGLAPKQWGGGAAATAGAGHEQGGSGAGKRKGKSVTGSSWCGWCGKGVGGSWKAGQKQRSVFSSRPHRCVVGKLTVDPRHLRRKGS